MRRKTTRHHRKPKCEGGGDESKNISRVKAKKHKAFHLIFSSGNVFKVARILNDFWIDPKYKLIVVERRQ